MLNIHMHTAATDGASAGAALLEHSGWPASEVDLVDRWRAEAERETAVEDPAAT